MAAPRGAASSRHYFLTHTLPLLLYLGLISVWSHCSTPSPVPVRAPLDKLAHVIEYLPVGVLLARWWCGRPARRLATVRSLIVVTALGVVFAVADEVHQSFVPGRTADPADVAADAAGIVGGALVWFTWVAVRRRRGASDGVPASRDRKYTSAEGR